jgi:hypothetical protein
MVELFFQNHHFVVVGILHILDKLVEDILQFDFQDKLVHILVVVGNHIQEVFVVDNNFVVEFVVDNNFVKEFVEELVMFGQQVEEVGVNNLH